MLKTQGIIFRLTKFKETSVIIEMYTETHGLKTFFMNGVYTKGKQKIASILQIMQIVDFEAYYQEQKDLHRIKEISPSYIYNRIPFIISYSASATFMMELCRKLFIEQNNSQESFDFIKSQFIQLDEMLTYDPDYHLKFMVALMQLLGLQPSLNFSEKNNSFNILEGHFQAEQLKNNYSCSTEQSQILFNLLSAKNKLSNRTERQMCTTILLKYLELHVDHFTNPKSLDVFRQIL